jgi:cellulose synthase operon protein C
VLADYEKRGGHNPATLNELASLEEGLGNPGQAAASLDRINNIYPNDEQLHRRLGELWLAQNNFAGAIREYSAVVAMHPMDVTSARFHLAQAYLAAGQTDQAKQNVVLALEAAPDYRPAQKLLLQLEDKGR